MNERGRESKDQTPKRATLADRYLSRTRRRFAASYGLLLALLLVAMVAATYIAARTHESTQIGDQLVSAALDKLRAPDLFQVLHQSPQLKDEEEAVRTFVISPDGVLRDADAVTSRPPDRAAVTSVLRGAGAIFTTILGPGGVLAVYTAPILRGGRVVGVVQTVTAKTPYNAVLQYLLLLSLVIGGVGLLVAGAAGFLMADWGLRPVRAAIASQRVFAQNAAHELRAPLTLMRTAGELALRSDEPGEMRDALATTIRQIDHLDAVVGDLRLLAQGDTGRLLVEVAPLDLTELVHEVGDEVRPAAEAQDIQLEVHVPPSLRVTADRQRLRQLLMILVDNALKYTTTGGRIDIRVSDQDRKAILIVQDTGSGIQARHLPHIFNRFYRAEEARSQNRGGAGLGLAIAREIVEAHGGRIEAQSRVGIGTTFRVTLSISTNSDPLPAG